MTASKDLQDVRPGSQHGAPNRPHSHSLSAGSYRVNRRKSSSSMAGVNIAALTAAARDAGNAATARAGSGRPVSSGAILSQSQALNRAYQLEGPDEDIKPPRSHGLEDKSSSVLEDGPPLCAMDKSDRSDAKKERMRRASEGTSLTRGERRRSNTGELRCDHCGKGYKHGSCLTKHLWEHRPEWNLTSKLLISKHQQVQLLEAASVLMTMNQDGTIVSETAIHGDSDGASDSPPASGSSDPQEDDQSSRTSSPSQNEESVTAAKDVLYHRPVRQDSYASTLSRSYQSTSATSFAPSSGPDGGEYQYSRRPSFHRRPSSASQFDGEENPEVVAAAQGLLSCSLGTPTHGPTQLPPDVPPVPPLPEKFARQASRPVSLQRANQTDVEMSGVQPSLVHNHNEEEDDGVFGHMDQ